MVDGEARSTEPEEMGPMAEANEPFQRKIETAQNNPAQLTQAGTFGTSPIFVRGAKLETPAGTCYTFSARNRWEKQIAVKAGLPREQIRDPIRTP